MKIYLTSLQLSFQAASISLSFSILEESLLKNLILLAKSVENAIVSEGKIQMSVINEVSQFLVTCFKQLPSLLI